MNDSNQPLQSKPPHTALVFDINQRSKDFIPVSATVTFQDNVEWSEEQINNMISDLAEFYDCSTNEIKAAHQSFLDVTNEQEFADVANNLYDKWSILQVGSGKIIMSRDLFLLALQDASLKAALQLNHPPKNVIPEDEWITARTKAISEMLDNPDSIGIYPTSKCFEALDEAAKIFAASNQAASVLSEQGILVESIAAILYKNKTDEADEGSWIESKDFYKIAELIAQSIHPVTNSEGVGSQQSSLTRCYGSNEPEYTEKDLLRRGDTEIG